jgi:uncharacterized protein (TIGR02996 family)
MAKSPISTPACRHPDEFGLLAAVLANPADDLPKLVYADWLDERADPRGQFVRQWLGWRKTGGKLPKPPTGVVKAWLGLIGYDLDRALAGLDEMPKWAGKIRGAVKPCLDVKTKRAKADKDIPVGVSKVGGCPDLPAGTDWPTNDDHPIAFLAQWNLAELAGSPAASPLPRSGLLSFFVDLQPYIDDEYDDDPPGLVLYTPDTGGLTRLKMPKDLPKECRLKPCRVTFTERGTVLGIDTVALKQARVMREEDQEAYAEFFSDVLEDGVVPIKGPHQILGNYQPIQEDPVQFKKEKDWLLLSQFNRDTACGLEVGDGGAFYFFIRREHLVAARFDRVFMELQMG